MATLEVACWQAGPNAGSGGVDPEWDRWQVVLRSARSREWRWLDDGFGAPVLTPGWLAPGMVP